MLSTTDAIVLSLQPHSDKAHILHAYTRTGGRVNYMVYGIGRKHAIGLYTPLTLLQITADHTSTKPPTLKEAVRLTSNSASGLTSNIYKQTICLFIAEVLFHVLKHPMADEPMYDFIAQAIEELDQTTEPQNFHLRFLAGFAAKLGFEIPSSSNPLPPSSTNPLTRSERQKALRSLCDYFAEHVETWKTPRSLDVLIEVFD